MTFTLPPWLERLCGLDVPAGEGTVCTLETAWPWPAWLRLVLLVLAAAAVVAVYVRENRRAGRGYRAMLAGMRLALVVIVFVMISQVSLSFQRTGLPYLALIVDDSISMTTLDRYENTIRTALQDRLQQAGISGDLTRWNLAKTLLAEHRGAMLEGMAEKRKLRVYFLTGVRASQEAEPAGIVEEIKRLDARGDTTRLGGAVRAVLDDLRGTVPAGIVLLTDGVNTDGPSLADAAAYARRKGVPLFLIGLGSDQQVRNLKLSDLVVDDVVFVNDIVNFECTLSGTGFSGTKVAVVLRREGKPEVLARTEAEVGPDGQSQKVRLPYRPTETGRFRFVVEVQPQPGEQQTDDNRVSQQVEVRREKIRVLLAQSYPSFEYRFLRNMLARDDTVELHTVLQDADPEYAQQDKTALRVFPVRRDELFAYDVVILGDADPGLLGPGVQQNLFEFVDRKGGGLVMLAGPKYMPHAYRDTPLERLMPFDLGALRFPDPARPVTEGFVAQPTELGLTRPPMQLGDTPQESRQIWQGLPPLYWMMEAPDLRPAARGGVWAEHPTRLGHEGRHLPVIVMHYSGAGTVLFHTTDETWRWRRRVGDVFFARYWIQALRFLARSKLADGNRSVRLRLTDGKQYRAGDPVRLQVRFTDERLAPAADDGVTIMVEHAGHKTTRVQLRRADSARGIFEGLLPPAAAGDYRAWIVVPTLEGPAPAITFQVAPPLGERVGVPMEAAEMRQAAELTAGQFYTFSTAQRLLGDLPEGRQVPIEALPPVSLWNKWPLLLLFFAVLIGEWLLRKRGGMV